MSQEQFGELLDTTRQTVSKWELDQVVPDVRKLIAICEKNVKTKQITYAYYYLDERGKKCVVSNCEGYDARLGTEKFDRKRLEKMDRIDSFLINHGEYPLHTVYELGIRKCLEEWNRGVRVCVGPESFFINLHTDKKEYVYQIRQEGDDVYCGISYNVPFDLGIRSYGQYYRLRNFQDNSKPFCGCFFDFDYQMPKEQYGIDCTKMACSLAGGANQGENGVWFIKRYSNDEIVLDGCGGDEYVYCKKTDMLERFTN